MFDPAELKQFKNALANLLADSDWASELLPDFDYAAQLLAINSLITRNRNAQMGHTSDIASLEKSIEAATSDEHRDWLEGQYADELHSSIYQDAAYSMAALGMIAPFVETLFTRAFAAIGKLERIEGISRTSLSGDDFWNCKFAWSSRDGRKEDLALGIWQLAESTGLVSYLPNDLRPRLTSLLAYRNFMFHNGLEWPTEARSRFADRMDREGWSTHFSMATSNEAAWIIYMSDAAIDWWLSALREILSGVGRYFRERVHPHI